MSSALGSIIGMLVAGTILIFIFVSALVGGISNALADADSVKKIIDILAKNKILKSK